MDKYRKSRNKKLLVYLADQNAEYGRSIGISNYTKCFLNLAYKFLDINFGFITSNSSIDPQIEGKQYRIKFSGIRRTSRLIIDNLHPLLIHPELEFDQIYYPKGFLPAFTQFKFRKIVTIHDTIIQHYADKYPEYRSRFDYFYWIESLKKTIINADLILTISESSKKSIQNFIDRYKLGRKNIYVTYQASLLENQEFVFENKKNEYFIHLASIEPHKNTSLLLKYWHTLQEYTTELPELILVGKIPDNATEIVKTIKKIRIFDFLPNEKFILKIKNASALLFPSEIEGFGLPALEGYLMGTPVIYAQHTAVDEILQNAEIIHGGFELDDFESFKKAYNEVQNLSLQQLEKYRYQILNTYSQKIFIEKFQDIVFK